jgi:para-nitrobenzyl esterase
MTPAMSATAETTHGRLRGVEHAAHVAFRGIPYARPPLGALRFTPPRPPEPWAGVRDASDFGRACPQPPSVLPGMAPGPQDEDCLYLNVYAPREPGRGRPVMVWIHGGGFTGGSAAQAIYDGGRLASRGDVVVVTVNYRLGPLGFLHLPAAGAACDDAASNPGILDQIAALAWVRDNAAAFGGDPANVTIFGESAGGMSVATLLASPLARGLFHRAIAQSGAGQATQDRDAAARTAHRLLAELGLGPHEASRLRDVPAMTLIEASARTTLAIQRAAFLVFAPMLDESVLPVHPEAAARAGDTRDVPLLVGTTLDEWRLFTFASPDHRRLDAAGLEKRIGRRLEGLGRREALESLLAVYRRRRPEAPPWELFDAIETDRLFRIPAIRLAEARAQRDRHAATYMYLFAWPSPAARGLLGACHAIELPFVFGTLDAPQIDRFSGSGPAAEHLSRRTMDAWLAFARGGAPGHGDLPDWSAYDAERRATLVLDAEPRTEDDPQADERRAWEGVL